MKHRLFFAIDLPDPCRSAVVDLQTRLDRLGLPVMWEEPAKLHLTLHFLGPTPQEQINSFTPGLQKLARSAPAFSLTPYFLETLYRRHEASLVYIGMEGDLTALKNLHKSLAGLLSGYQLPAQNRFFPHITIGRLRRDDPVTTKNFLSRIDAVDIQPLPSFLVDHLTLYESDLSPAGSHYQKIGQYGLE